ncbi:glycosyltransferase family 52 [Enterobacteriaceae bacterium LUAb1]
MKKISDKYDHVCMVDSVYSLFLYFLICQKFLKKTLFIISDGIPVSIRSKLVPYIYVSSHKKSKCSSLRRMLTALILKSKISKFFNENDHVAVYAQDHLFYSFAVLNRKYVLLEDGLGNYLPHRTTLSSIVRTVLLRGKEWGYNHRAEKIIFTGMREIPIKLKAKSVLIDIQSLWDEIEEKKKDVLVNVFMGKTVLHGVYKYILLTQPFSEEGALSENEKIDLYKKIVKKYKGLPLTIKPHPREKTDYDKYFDCPVLDRDFPFQLLLLLSGATKIITCFSSLPKEKKDMTIDFYGSELSEKLIKRYGLIKASTHD